MKPAPPLFTLYNRLSQAYTTAPMISALQAFEEARTQYIAAKAHANAARIPVYSFYVLNPYNTGATQGTRFEYVRSIYVHDLSLYEREREACLRITRSVFIAQEVLAADSVRYTPNNRKLTIAPLPRTQGDLFDGINKQWIPATIQTMGMEGCCATATTAIPKPNAWIEPDFANPHAMAIIFVDSPQICQIPI